MGGMKSAYMSLTLDRLRDGRRSIHNKGEGMSTLVTQRPEVKVGLLLVEAILNLADTIQTIHEEGQKGNGQA
jgi:hypothetical protein